MISPRFLLGLLVLPLAACGGSEPREAPPEPEAAPAPAPAEPVVARDSWFEADREEHDFGVVHPDSVQETVFRLTAAGTEDLIVDKVVRSCGCTKGELFVMEDGERVPVELGDAYAPGTEFELLAKLDTTKKQGVQKQSVAVLIEGRDVPVAYTIHADIVPFLVVEPRNMIFGKVSTLEGAEREATVQTETGEPFELTTNYDELDPGVEVDFLPVDPDAEGRASTWKMKVRVAQGAPAGELISQFMVVTDVVNGEAANRAEALTHRAVYSLEADVDGVVSVTPDRISFGSVAAGGEAVRRFSVRCKDPEFSMSNLRLRVESGTPGFEDALVIDANEAEPGVLWQVDVRLTGLTRPGPFMGKIAVYFDHPYQEMTTVSLRGVMGTEP